MNSAILFHNSWIRFSGSWERSIKKLKINIVQEYARYGRNSHCMVGMILLHLPKVVVMQV